MPVTHLRSWLRTGYHRLRRLHGLLFKRWHLLLGLQPLRRYATWDRSLPICRHYIQAFMEAHRQYIHGHVLEFQNDAYASRYGRQAVDRLAILHRDPGNPEATMVADITVPGSLPENTFDCIICTQVIHMIAELDVAVQELYRSLKPGASLLLTVPQSGPSYQGITEYWRFTEAGLEHFLRKNLPTAQVTCTSYGNSLTAAGEMRGLSTFEFTEAELNAHDGSFGIIAAAHVTRPC